VTDPISNPAAFERITLNDKEIPLFCERSEGGDREWVIEQQQSPGYAGAYTAVKNERLSSVTYRFHLWLPSHFVLFRPWLDTFRAGQKRRPPRTYTVNDLSIEHNEIKQLVVRRISPLVKVSPGRYAYDIGGDEYRKRRPIGGVAVPAKTEAERELEATRAEGVRLDAQYKALQAADARGETDFLSGFKVLLGD
jgi:hypothetical protein